MSHLDEGTLHALLDGELDLHEVKEIQAHIGSCTACGTRLREVKEFHGESDRLVSVLEMPSGPTRRTAITGEEDEVEPVAYRPPLPVAPRAPIRLPRVSGPAAEPPPLLLPDAVDHDRSRLIRRMRWAALILVTVGAGYLGSQMRSAPEFVFDGTPLPTGASDSGGAVLSSEEAVAADEPDSTRGGSLAKDNAAPPAAQARPSTPAPDRLTARSQTPAAGERAKRAVAPAQKLPAANDTAEERSEEITVAGPSEPLIPRGESVDEAGADDSAAEAAPEEDVDAPAVASAADVRAEASQALRQLDRERQMRRAAAATAALDSARRRELARQAVAPQPPAPRTPEQRAQIELRIGLDEAAKQLGRPVHVIEGMSALFMGLASGRLSPGADPARPVVRVVYQDSQGRLILLDQQRIRPGNPPPNPVGPRARSPCVWVER